MVAKRTFFRALSACLVWLSAIHCAPTAQAQSPRIDLQSIPTSPYAGQTVTLQATLYGPFPSEPLELHAAWLAQPPAGCMWLESPEIWACKQTLPSAKSLSLSFQGIRIYARADNSGQFVLRWQFRVIGDGESSLPVLRFEPLHVGTWRSTALVVPVQSVPFPPLATSAWNLGVGVWRLRASWHPPTIPLGQESMLEISVESDSDLAALRPPTLATQAGWESNAYTVVPAPETWRDQGTKRVFRFLVRPRRLGGRPPPSLLATAFDPTIGQWQAIRLSIPTLTVTSGSGMNSTATSSPNAAHSIEFNGRSLFPQDAPDSQPRRILTQIALLLPAVILLALFAHLAVQHWADEWLQRWHWRLGRRRTKRRIQSTTRPLKPPELAEVLTYLARSGNAKCSISNTDDLRHALRETPLRERGADLVELLDAYSFGPAGFLNWEAIRRQILDILQEEAASQATNGESHSP